MLFTILLVLLLTSVICNVFLIISLKRSFFQIDVLESWIVDFKSLVDNTYKKLKNIDDRGIFEKDDDVGILFKDIQNIIEVTNKRVQFQSDDENIQSRNINEKI